MNKHLIHFEELPLLKGMEETRLAFDRLLFATGDSSITMKMDGSPAFVIGHDPKDGEFFVSTKSFFNKTPIMYKTWDDFKTIDDLELRQKLYMLHFYLRDMEFSGYIQGDYLFHRKDLTYNYDLDTLMYHPNTLVYGVDQQYDIGVAFHTYYTENMNPVYGYDFSKLIIAPDVLNVDVLVNRQWRVGFNRDDLEDQLINARLVVNDDFVDDLVKTPKLAKLITQFFNTKIRAGVPLMHSELIDELGVWISARNTKDTPDHLQFFAGVNRYKMICLLSYIHTLSVVKHECINRLNQFSKVKTWVLTHDGYVPAEPEGYVLNYGGEACKLVDRSKFSYYNFSPNFVKGWDKPTRT